MSQLTQIVLSLLAGWIVVTYVVVRDFGLTPGLVVLAIGVLTALGFSRLLAACRANESETMAREETARALLAEVNQISLDDARATVLGGGLDAVGLVMTPREPQRATPSPDSPATVEFFGRFTSVTDPGSYLRMETFDPSHDDGAVPIGSYVWEHTSIWMAAGGDTVLVRADDEPDSPELYCFTSVYHLLLYLIRTGIEGTHVSSTHPKT